MTIVLGKGFTLWPKRDAEMSVAEVVNLYQQGFAGAWHEPEAKASLRAQMPNPDGAAIATQFGLAESGKGKLCLPFLYAYKHWPKCWPAPGQTTGNCVGKAGKNIALILLGVEAGLAMPDEVTGVVEGFPVVTAEAEEQGVCADEPGYGYRGHRGQGANCSVIQEYYLTAGGIFLRKNYPELNLDLTRCQTQISINWGGSGPPAAVNAEGKKHQIRTATECDNHEVCRDFVANGYPIWVCSGLGWSSKKDENGYSKQQGGWSHSWVVMGYDDRETTIAKYGFPLFLYNHDWGIWNSGGTRIMGTDIDIPKGAFWADARLLNRCECVAMSSTNGWPAQAIPDLGATGRV